MSDLGLEEIKEIAEDYLIDECVVFVEQRGPFDPTTGDYTFVNTVRYRGKCMVVGIPQAVERPEFGGPRKVTNYTVYVPLEVVSIEDGDLIELESCAYDPSLVGKRFQVISPIVNTFAVWREVQVSHWNPVT